MDREDFKIANRHMSESQWRAAWCRKTGKDEHDLDGEIWAERERRNEYYRELDGH